MRIRTVLTAAVLASVAAVLPLAGVASAQAAPSAPTDRECRDFASQAAAQSALRSHSGDPARLDPDHNGVACEAYFRTALPGAAPGDAAPAQPVPDAPVPADPPALPVPSAPVPAVPVPAAPVPAVPDAPAVPAPPAGVPVPDAPAVPGTQAETSVKTGAPADAVVRTVPEHQILVMPHGAADTGDGSTLPGTAGSAPAVPDPLVLLAGALGAAATLGGGYRLVRRSR